MKVKPTDYPEEQLPSILEYLLHCQRGLEKICIEQGWKDTKEFERLLKIDVEVNELRDYLYGGVQ